MKGSKIVMRSPHVRIFRSAVPLSMQPVHMLHPAVYQFGERLDSSMA